MLHIQRKHEAEDKVEGDKISGGNIRYIEMYAE